MGVTHRTARADRDRRAGFVESDQPDHYRPGCPRSPGLGATVWHFRDTQPLIPDQPPNEPLLDLVSRINLWQRAFGPCGLTIFRRRSSLFHGVVTIAFGMVACLPGQPVEAAQKSSRVQVHTLAMRTKTPGIALDSVSCVDATYCEAVGAVHAVNSWVPSNSDTPAIMHFNGRVRSESVAPRPSGAELHAIDCPKRGSCVAVGQVNDAPFIKEL